MVLGSGAEHRRIEVVEVAVNPPGRDMHLGASAEGGRSRLVWPGMSSSSHEGHMPNFVLDIANLAT